MRVAVIVLTYNGRHLIDACLDAVRRHTRLEDVQVVVVDNASTDGSADHVADAHPWVRLVRNPENVGFAGGVNTGMAAVPASAYVLLNSDALVTPGWLDRLERTAGEERAGIVSALEVGEDGRPRWGPDLPPIPERRPEQRDVVSFACALIRRDVVDRIGYLDHGYFMYHEDWDYCHRANAAGFRVVFDPRAVVVHPGEGSFKAQVPAWKVRIRTASRLRYQGTHWRGAKRLRGLLREPLLAAYWAKEGLLGPYLQGARFSWRERKDVSARRRALTGFVGWKDAPRPMHVALALPFPGWSPTGGAERHVHELATALAASGTRVTVFAAAPAPAPPKGLPYAALVLDSRRLRAFAALRARLPAGRTWARRAQDREFNRLAERAAAAAQADVLHRHFVHEGGFRPRLPLVYTLHNGDLPRDADGPLGRLAARDVAAREAGIRAGITDADAVVCVSGHVRDSVLGRLGVDRSVAVIGNGCPHPPPTLTKANARGRLGLGRERVVLFIGHLWRHKRVLRLLPLLEEPDVHLVLIGAGELEGELRRHAATQPRLRLLGVVDEATKRLWLRAADVLALPSDRFEGNPIVMMEALRSGTPVYGTMEGWLPEQLRKHGRFGEDVRLALEAARIDASAAIGQVPGWDEVAGETAAVYREAVASYVARAKRERR